MACAVSGATYIFHSPVEIHLICNQMLFPLHQGHLIPHHHTGYNQSDLNMNVTDLNPSALEFSPYTQTAEL